MNDTIARLEERLAEYVGRRYCLSTGSGTMALTVALKALGLPRRSEVIIPSICCRAVPFAVIYAGLTPVFCDVNMYDYNISLESIADAVSNKTRVIIPVHSFGYPSPMDELLKYAKDRSIVVLEDAAQAFGGSSRGRKLGSFGDLSITSFGYAKIIDVGGGGAVFTDNCHLAKAMKDINGRMLKHRDMSSRFARKMYLRMEKWKSRNVNPSRMILNLERSLHRLISFTEMKRHWGECILKAMDSIDDVTLMRKKKAELYRRLIKSESILHPRYESEEGTCFRYSVLLRHERRKAVQDELNKRGVWVSTLYPALHRLYRHSGDPGERRRPNSEYIESHIINLLVDPSTGEEKIRQIAEVINEVA